MSTNTLDDQLHELRLSAFLTALQEQRANAQYSELSFEDRLALLVDAECCQRRENRVKRNIRAAGFPMCRGRGFHRLPVHRAAQHGVGHLLLRGEVLRRRVRTLSDPGQHHPAAG